MLTALFEDMPDMFYHTLASDGLQSHFIAVNEPDPNMVRCAIIRTATIFDRALFDTYPNLELVIRAGTGHDNIDLEYAGQRNVVVCNTPEANAPSAAEHAVSFIFALIKQHRRMYDSVIDGSWKNDLPLNLELADLRLLIVGLGRVGSQVASIMSLFGADVRACDPYLTAVDWVRRGIERIGYREGLEWANCVSFHCPLTSETRGLFGAEHLAIPREPILLVNTARGGIISEETIASGLQSGKLAGVAVDVFEREPWEPSMWALSKNVLLSPHAGAWTNAAKNRLSVETVEVWKRFWIDGDRRSNIIRYPKPEKTSRDYR